MGHRDAQLWEDFRGYSASYEEHKGKIHSNLKDRTMQFAISGWINDCRHFADKVRDISLRLIERGGSLRLVRKGTTSKSNVSESDIQVWHASQIRWLDEAERVNNQRR